MKNGGGLTGLVTTVVGSSKSKIKTLPDIYALCIGVSQNMTDTIMVAKYSPQNQQAALLSIPRDTFCGKSRASASASDKINAIYPISGPAKTMEKVNELTGLNIKYYIVVDTKA
jgi:anionic cell wall polymer biosynthesis LytR-Cps2A-Psr (LCP) family protein